MTGVELIAAERQRQIAEEGWDAAHDAGHSDELARAGATYATPPERRPSVVELISDLSGRGPQREALVPETWPWDAEWWKPSDSRLRELVKAGALIAAAIDALVPSEPISEETRP